MTNESPQTKQRSKRQLTAREKAEAIRLWKDGSVTMEQLEKRFGKNASTFHRLFSKEGVKKGENAEEVARKVEEAVDKEIADDAATLANRIRETKESHYKLTETIRKLILNEVAEARKNKEPISSRAPNLKAWEILQRVLKMNREEAYQLLGIKDETDNDDEIPDLVVKELTTEEIEQRNRAAMQEDENKQNDEFGLDDGLSDDIDIDVLDDEDGD